MQYVGQTDRSLKTRFPEHFRKMKKPKKIDAFLYRHLKNNGHSPSKIIIQPVEKIIYDPNSSSKYKKNIKRHESELKWINFLQSPFPLGFNDNTYHMKVIFLKCQILMLFVLLQGEELPQCVGCDAPFTVRHFLLECGDFAQVRNNCFHVDNMKELFQDIHIDSIMTFLRQINLF